MSFREWFQTQSPSPVAASAGPEALTPEEAELLEKIAARVVRWQMTIPAILFLESVKPLNYLGSQALVFFEPIVQSLFNVKEYDTFRIMMERRENVERLLVKIEELDAQLLGRERAARDERRAARRGKWWWPFGRKDQTPSPPL